MHDQEISQKNSDNRKQQKGKHRVGSKSYSQLSFEKVRHQQEKAYHWRTQLSYRWRTAVRQHYVASGNRIPLANCCSPAVVKITTGEQGPVRQWYVRQWYICSPVVCSPVVYFLFFFVFAFQPYRYMYIQVYIGAAVYKLCYLDKTYTENTQTSAQIIFIEIYHTHSFQTNTIVHEIEVETEIIFLHAYGHTHIYVVAAKLVTSFKSNYYMHTTLNNNLEGDGSSQLPPPFVSLHHRSVVMHVGTPVTPI